MAEPINREDIAQIYETLADRVAHNTPGTLGPRLERDARVHALRQRAADTRHADQMPRLGVQSQLYRMSRGR